MRRTDGRTERRKAAPATLWSGLTIASGRIAEMNILADPDRLERLDLSAIGG